MGDVSLVGERKLALLGDGELWRVDGPSSSVESFACVQVLPTVRVDAVDGQAGPHQVELRRQVTEQASTCVHVTPTRQKAFLLERLQHLAESAQLGLRVLATIR